MDDFEDYEPGDLTEATGEVWEGSGTTSIVEEDGLQFLNYGGDGTTTRAVRDLGEENYLTDGATGTYFFRMRRNEETVDNSMGFAQTADTGSGFGVYLPQARVIGSGLSVRDGDGFDDGLSDVDVEVWNNVWMVVDMASGTWDLYFSQEFDEAELIQTDIGFRADGDSIETAFFIAASGGGPISIDDIYFTLGEDTSNPTVDLENFQFVQEPRDASVFIGDEVTFSAIARGGDGEGEVSYQWQVSSDEGTTWTDIEGATESSFTIASASFDQNGNLYRAEASRDGETVVSDAAELIVSFPDPEVVEDIEQGVLVFDGETFAYSVEATGLGNITYQWQQDGVDLEGETGTTLELDPVTTDLDQSVFSVIITDDAAEEQEGLEPTSVTLSATLNVAPRLKQAISLNFMGAGSGDFGSSDQLGVIEPHELAGANPVANWNNGEGAATEAPMDLVDDIGSDTTATATWTSDNTWSANAAVAWFAGDTTQRLFHGYIETRAGLGDVEDATTVTLEGIPYDTYDVYVYPMGTSGQAGSLARSVTLDAEGEEEVRQKFMTNLFGGPTPEEAEFVLSNSATLEDAQETPPASYFRFAGVSGSSVVLQHFDIGGNLGGFAGISIVDTTESTPARPGFVERPADRFVPAGEEVEFSVSAESFNEGGSLSYQWQKDGEDLAGETGATLTLTNVGSADAGRYTVVVTDDSNLDPSINTASAFLVVVDESRFALVNVDMNVAGDPMSGDGMLLPDGLQDFVFPASIDDNPMNIGEGDSLWNSLIGATGTTTYENLVDSEGLALPGLTFTVEGATGAEDDVDGGGLETFDADPNYSAPLFRDYVFTEGEDEMTLTVGGLNAFAGLEVTLVVYALGKDSTDWPDAGGQTPDQDDEATVTLAEANNESGQAPVATDQQGGDDNDGGREMRWNDTSFAAFDALVAANGTVSWTIGPVDGEPGLNAFNGFQLLITNQGEAIEPEGIADWRQTHFGMTENEGDAANDADPDGDGFKNLVEYALGTDPTVAGDGPSALSQGEAGDFLTLTFDHIADSNLTYAVEATNDVNGTWTEVQNYGSFATSGTQTFTDDQAISANSQRFLRLKVTVSE